jgi:hypothetical protein
VPFRSGSAAIPKLRILQQAAQLGVCCPVRPVAVVPAHHADALVAITGIPIAQYSPTFVDEPPAALRPCA